MAMISRHLNVTNAVDRWVTENSVTWLYGYLVHAQDRFPDVWHLVFKVKSAGFTVLDGDLEVLLEYPFPDGVMIPSIAPGEDVEVWYMNETLLFPSDN